MPGRGLVEWLDTEAIAKIVEDKADGSQFGITFFRESTVMASVKAIKRVRFRMDLINNPSRLSGFPIFLGMDSWCEIIETH